MVRDWLGGLSLALVVGCSASGQKPEVPPVPVLHIYTWSDYMKPEVVRRFETEHGCRVEIDTFDSNEAMYDQLNSREKGPFDLLFPSSYMVKLLHGQGRLRELNPDWIPNRINIDGLYLAMAFDQEMAYSVPYAVTITSLGYRASKVPDFQPSWAMLDRPDLRGHMTMLDDYRETIGAALKYLGCSLNTTNDAELARAKEVVLRWKRNLSGFQNEDYKDGLAAGEIRLAHGYSGDLMAGQAENEDIRIAVPEEGSALSFDDMVIPVDACHPELAHKFINFVLEPRVAAELTEYIYFLCPNEVSYQYLSPEIRSNPILFPPLEAVDKLEMIGDLGAGKAQYEKLWEEIKAGD